MPQQRRYILSAVTNWLAFAATLLVAFFLAPYLIRKLGDGRYGLWVFVESILAYFTLFDLGIAAGVVRFTAKYRTENNPQQLNRLVSSCLALFLGLGIVAFLVGLALMPLFSSIMAKSGMQPAEIVGFALLMLGNLALSLPLSVFPSVLDGLERFASKSLVRIVFLALRTTAIVFVMERGANLIALGAIFTIGNLLEHFAMVGLCFFFQPGLHLSARLVDRATLRTVKGYSLHAFLAMIAGRVSVQSGAIVIGVFLSAPEITWFAIALRLVEFAKALLRSATTTLTPAISSLEAAGDLEAIRRILFKATRWVLYLMIPIQLGLVMFGREFLRIWLGSSEYAEHCYPALVVLSATLALVVAQSVASRILYGMGQLKTFSLATLGEAGLNITLCLSLVNQWGIEGIAWAAAVPSFLFCVFVIGLACRMLCVTAGLYLSQTWWKPLFAGFVPLAIWQIGWQVDGWLTFGIAIAGGLIPYAAIVLVLEGRLRSRHVSIKQASSRSIPKAA